MNKITIKKEYLIFLSIVVLLFFGFQSLGANKVSFLERMAEFAGIRYADNLTAKTDIDNLILTKEDAVEEKPLGAVSGPDISSDYLSVGGLTQHYRSARLIETGTTTPCSFKAPNATTTLISYGFSITTGTSTDATFGIGTSTTAYSTSSTIFAPFLSSGAKGSFFWTPAGGGVQDSIIEPNAWIVMKLSSAGSDGWKFKGRCSAILKEF